MPTFPPSRCETFGCRSPSVSHSRYCIEHAPAPRDRAADDTLYKGMWWRRTRWQQLTRSPLCAACASAGRVTPATAVDHVFPWRRIGTGAFYVNRLQSLCSACHSVKTALEAKGIIRDYVNGTDYTLGDYAEQCPGA